MAIRDDVALLVHIPRSLRRRARIAAIAADATLADFVASALQAAVSLEQSLEVIQAADNAEGTTDTTRPVGRVMRAIESCIPSA